MIIAFLIIALLFFVILYANQKKQNNSTVHQNNIYVAELEKQQNISRQLTNYRNDPDIPRLNFDQEINEEVVSSFLQEVDYRFVIE